MDNSPPEQRPATPATSLHATAGLRFSLAVFPESLQQRWHAVLLGEAPLAGPPLEFTSPLDLLRHLAELSALSPAPSTTPPTHPSSSVRLR